MQGNDSYRLIVRRGPQPNQTFDLNKDILSLGRDITNDIVLNDPEVSRHHLRLTRGADGFNIEDLGSTNGTFINGQRLSGVRPLNRGDIIGLGETVTLGYEVVRAPGEAPISGPAPQTAVRGDYAPPGGEAYYQPPQQPEAPYQAPGQPGGYQQQQQGGYYQEYEQQPAPGVDYGYGAASPQAPPSYGYDPYEIREEPGRSTLSWVAIGCAILGVFCCCSSVVGLVIVDALNLWYDLPIINSLAPLFERIARAFGLI